MNIPSHAEAVKTRSTTAAQGLTDQQPIGLLQRAAQDLEQAIVQEPEPDDKSDLRGALALVRKVLAKNQRQMSSMGQQVLSKVG